MSNAANRTIHLIAAALTLAVIAASGNRPLFAQGLTGASVEGSIVTDSGAPVRGAVVTLTQSGTGVARRVVSGERGMYLFENVGIGTYRIEVRVIGSLPSALQGIRIHLGDRVRARLVLGTAAMQELAQVTVNSPMLRDPGAGGPAHSVSSEAVRSLPLLNRDFVGLLAMSPQAVGPGSLWVSGQHSRFNGIQIDGASGNDLFGTNVTPGSNAGALSVSLEAIEEIRILVAPFDVRQGGFSGGLINAVTRSGSNELHGSMFSSYSRSELAGRDTAAGVPAFDNLRYGMSVGGPIVRDRLHFFAAVEAQSQTTRFADPPVDELAAGVNQATALRAGQALRDRFAFDPGGPEAHELRQPNSNLFLKLSWHPSSSHSVELTQSLSLAGTDALNRSMRSLDNSDGWQLSNSGTVSQSKAFTVRLKAISTLGAFTNEAILSSSTIADDIDSRNKVPLFIIESDASNMYLSAGSVRGAQGTNTSQRVFELTDNVSWSRGAHLLTFGTQNVLLHVRDNLFPGSWGIWSFISVDALEKNIASRYEVALPLTEGGPRVDYSSALLSAYVQDHWRLHDRLSMTAGIRAEYPLFDAPRSNPVLLSDWKLGKKIDTGLFPTDNVVLAPRIGFAWELGKDHRSMLRGGVGAFTGRPPLAWLTGAYSSTGQEQTTLVCGLSDGVPLPTSDISRLPSHCLNATARASVPSVSYFHPGFRFQQAIKYAAGIDHDFGHSLLASLDVIYTRSRNSVFLSDINLVERGLNGEGRAMYGSIATNGVGRPTRRDSLGYGAVYYYENVSGDRSASVSVSAQRTWRSGAFAQIGYDWSRTTDVMSMAGFSSPVIFRSNPVDGSLSHRTQARSARDVPHNFVAVAIVPVGSGITASAYFRARSGTPYAFTANGDANADGAPRNDLAYIPNGANDLSLENPEAYPALNAFIESEPCMRRQRGRIMTRNSCRNAAVTALDGRIAKKLWTRNARSFEIWADLFNIPNMVNRQWGLARETSSREDIPLLSVSGWDSAMNRPRYSIPVAANGEPILPTVDSVMPDASRWRVQLGARYDF